MALTRGRKILIGVGGLVALYFISSATFYRWPERRGIVLEAATDAPVEGAAVVAVYYVEYIESSVSYEDAQEAVTGPDGSFTIPAKTVFSLHGPPSSYKKEPDVYIFKSGYGRYPGDYLAPQPFYDSRDDVRTYWLRTGLTFNEKRLNLHSRPLEVPKSKMRNYTRQINVERRSLGYSDLPEE